jgi:phosphatidylserine/phosphatidylglycerophosphate/cardiolipin synthase-like enzyme/uncharacterized membrane protein YdjX (TVP38/TMEM64 family)
MTEAASETILKEGENCWRIAPAERVAFLVDGEAFFAAFAAAVERAQQSVFIVGWDIDSGIRLWRDEVSRDLPAELGNFLNAVVARRKRLRVYILDWDFALLYALEREPLPSLRFGWRGDRRLRFALDDNHPVGASQHQKLVVVDDRVAFVGGFDLARNRWDTPEHAPDDERRVDRGSSYPPFHDVQMLVEGEAAAALGELARERWRRATGERPRSPKGTPGDPWPPGLGAALSRVEVAISRTSHAWEGQPEVCEVKRLYLDAIAAARSGIFIESQYFTSAAVGDALAGRLQEKDGPEVVLVLPRECSGWLEENTMGVLRARLLRRLSEADRFNRLRVFYPERSDLGGRSIQVHSKVMVVDDLLVRVGSANLNNRSMGLDSECDLAIEAGTREEVREAIRVFRNRLLGEHLGVSLQRMEAALAAEGSMIRAIEALRHPPRFLAPLRAQVEPWVDMLVPDATLIDPERPARIEDLADALVPPEEKARKSARPRAVGLLLLLGATLALAAAWRWTPLSEWLDLQTLKEWGATFRENRYALLLVLAAYLLGGLVLVPVTLLILVTAFTFPPVEAVLYALGGSLLSALSTFGLGRLLGRETVRRLAGARLNRLSRWLGRRGLVAMTAVRLFPVAPFTVVNMVAGTSHIRLRDFTFGTLLGMVPGVLAITVFERSLEQAVAEPATGNFLLLGAVLVAVVGLAWGVRRWLSRMKPPEEGGRGGIGD